MAPWWKELVVFIALVTVVARDVPGETWASPPAAAGTRPQIGSRPVPNAVGATAAFFNAANGAIPAQSENRIISLDEPVTVGSSTFHNDAANGFTNRLGPFGRRFRQH